MEPTKLTAAWPNKGAGKYARSTGNPNNFNNNGKSNNMSLISSQSGGSSGNNNNGTTNGNAGSGNNGNPGHYSAGVANNTNGGSAKSRLFYEQRKSRSHSGGAKVSKKQAKANALANPEPIEPDLAQELEQMVRSGATTVDLSDRGLGAEHVRVIAEALKGNKSVTKLILRKNPIGDMGCEMLADALRFNMGLKEIDLSYTDSSGNGVRALCKKLKESKWLKARVRKLNVVGNRHGSRGPTAIYRTLSFASSLRELTLDRMNHEGAERLSSALSSNQTPLVRLTLLHCEVDDEFATSIAKILSTHESLRALTIGTISSTSALACMVEPLTTPGATKLEELVLVNLIVTAPVLLLIAKVLAVDRQLTKLCLEDAVCEVSVHSEARTTFLRSLDSHPAIKNVPGLSFASASVSSGDVNLDSTITPQMKFASDEPPSTFFEDSSDMSNASILSQAQLRAPPTKSVALEAASRMAKMSATPASQQVPQQFSPQAGISQRRSVEVSNSMPISWNFSPPDHSANLSQPLAEIYEPQIGKPQVQQPYKVVQSKDISLRATAPVYQHVSPANITHRQERAQQQFLYQQEPVGQQPASHRYQHRYRQHQDSPHSGAPHSLPANMSDQHFLSRRSSDGALMNTNFGPDLDPKMTAQAVHPATVRATTNLPPPGFNYTAAGAGAVSFSQQQQQHLFHQQQRAEQPLQALQQHQQSQMQVRMPQQQQQQQQQLLMQQQNNQKEQGPTTSSERCGLIPSGFDPSLWGNIDPHLQEEIMSGFGNLWSSNNRGHGHL